MGTNTDPRKFFLDEDNIIFSVFVPKFSLYSIQSNFRVLGTFAIKVENT